MPPLSQRHSTWIYMIVRCEYLRRVYKKQQLGSEFTKQNHSHNPSQFGQSIRVYSMPMLSIRRVRLTFSNALSTRSWAMERLAIRARRTGRQATKMPLTCERAEDSSDAFNPASPSVPPSGTIVVGEPSSVSFKMAFWSSAASLWSLSVVSKYERHRILRFKSKHT